MTRDEVYKELMDKAIENKVELTDKAYMIADFRAKGNIPLSKCPCCLHDPERFCISEKCMKAIQEKGVCGCKCFKRFGG